MNQIAALEKREVEASRAWVGTQTGNSGMNYESFSEKVE